MRGLTPINNDIIGADTDYSAFLDLPNTTLD